MHKYCRTRNYDHLFAKTKNNAWIGGIILNVKSRSYIFPSCFQRRKRIRPQTQQSNSSTGWSSCRRTVSIYPGRRSNDKRDRRWEIELFNHEIMVTNWIAISSYRALHHVDLRITALDPLETHAPRIFLPLPFHTKIAFYRSKNRLCSIYYILSQSRWVSISFV